MGGRRNLGIVLFLLSLSFCLIANLYHSHFYSPFYMYRAQSLSLHSPLIISGGPLNPQCLAHKRCSLCEQEGRAHALSFSVLCGVTASLAFLVFSFLCVVFFFFFGNIMGIVCKTHCTASLSCGSAHGPSPLDLLSHPPLECTAGSFQMSHSKSTAVCRLLHCGALPAK